MDQDALFRSIDDTVQLSFSRSSGAGGQNVNKVSTKVSARVSLSELDGLSEAERRQVALRLGAKLTSNGEVIVRASEHRSQLHNRTAAIERLRQLLLDAAAESRPRRPSSPSRASRRSRLEAKRRRGARKRLRGRVDPSAEG